VRPGDERGSVTVIAAGVIVVVLVCTMGVADVGRVLAERSRAQTAADAAALAAAQDLAVSDGDPAADAASFATMNGADLVSCTCDAGTSEALVQVRRTFGGLLLLPGSHQIEMSARAVVETPSA
jgi:secretion/DNA translocation related TadE-like protein